MSPLPAAAAAFLLHGAGTLLLESAWVRAQTAVFGATPAAPGSVLVAYFVGLALGSWRWRGGALATRRALPWLVAALAAGALLPWLPPATAGLAVTGGAGALLSPAVLWAAAAVLVLPACVALGAFFPLIGRFGGPGATLALYGLEAAGALPGVVLGSLVLPRVAGGRATAAAGAAAILLSWWLLRRALAAAPAQAAPPARRAGWADRRLLCLAAGSGVLSVVLQSVWIRLLSLRADNSVFAFGAVSLLVIFLLAAASFAVSRLPDRVALSRHAVPLLLAAIVAGGLAAAALWLRVTDGLAIRLVENASGLDASLRLAAPLVTTGSLAASLLLPLLLRGAASAPGDRGRTVGGLIAANGIGCAAGAAGASFLLLPHLGVWATLSAALAGYLALLLFADRGAGRALAAASGLAALALFNPARHPVVTPSDPFNGPPGTVVSVEEGAHGVVAVIDYPDGIRSLWLNNTYLLEAFTGDSSATLRLGILPAVLRPGATGAAMIGVGTGVSASGLFDGGLGRVDLVELIPEVAEAARRHFATQNRSILDDPRARLVVGDGRLVLARTGERYDIVGTDLVTPWNEGAPALYTREHFRVVRSRLRPGGIFCLWLPLFQLNRLELLSIARTMTAVFPSVTLWHLGSGSGHAVAALVGAEGPLDLTGIARSLRTRPRQPGFTDPLLAHESAAVALYVGPVEPDDPLLAESPVNTLDRPVVELLAARPGRTLLKGAELLEFLGEFYRRAANPGGRYFSGWSADADDWRMIGRDILLYQWYLENGDYARAEPLESRIGSLPAYREP